MKIKVLVDVANFQIRAFIQHSDEIIPTNEIQRIIYYESGGEHPDIGNDIYDQFSRIEQKKIDDIVGMISISGIRGTVEVDYMGTMKLPTLTCLRCGHSWHPRSDKKPKNCPNVKCNSPYWDRPRQKNLKKEEIK